MKTKQKTKTLEWYRHILIIDIIILSVLFLGILASTICVVKQVRADDTKRVIFYKVEKSETHIESTITPEIKKEPVPESEPLVMDKEINLLALVTMAEAEGESEMGKRLVIDTILNRVDDKRFPNSISGVIYQKNQFEAMWNGRVDRCYVRNDIRQLVIEELQNRTNSEVIYFRTGHYSSYGTPVFKVGNHYFSKN